MKMVSRFARLAVVVLVSASLAISACGGPVRTPTVDSNLPTEDTTLGLGDVFDIRVFGEAELTGTYRVGPDGSIDYPLVGRIRVAGLEPAIVADRVSVALRDGRYLVSPQVSVFVKEYNSKRISVVGAVNHPGSFPMASGLTVVQAIGLAGGFSSIANRNATVVTRRTGGRLQRFAVPAARVIEGQTDDFSLQAGDIVYVPESPFPM